MSLKRLEISLSIIILIALSLIFTACGQKETDPVNEEIQSNAVDKEREAKLIKRLEHTNVEVRIKALIEVEILDNETSEKLMIMALRDADSRVRIKAIQGLERRKSEKAVPELLDLIKTDSDKRVKWLAAKVALHINKDNALPALYDGLLSDDFALQGAASGAIRTIKSPDIPLAMIGFLNKKESSLRTREEAIKILALYPEPSVKSSLGHISKNSDEPRLVFYARLSLAQQGDGSQKPFLLDALANGPEYQRIYTSELAAALGWQEAVEIIRENMNHKKSKVRSQSIKVLAAINDTESAVPIAYRMNKEGRTSPAFTQAVIALMKFREKKTAANLIAAWRKNPELILQALTVITGENFGFDQVAWRNWWKEQPEAEEVRQMNQIIDKDPEPEDEDDGYEEVSPDTN
jgi:HEAT repeat protein